MIVEDLLRLAGAQPNAPAVVVRGDGERETERAGYGELVARVRGLAGRLHAHSLRGCPVVVALPAGLDYVVAVLACMFAGAYAVPMPEPPPCGRVNRRWDAVMAQLRPSAVVALRPVAGAPLTISPHDVDDFAAPEGAGDGRATAFIQYTSGSTAAPRGVIVSYEALAANRAMIHDGFGLEDSRAVTWLPPYHDMGLVGGLLQPLTAGALVVVLPPLTVVQRPLRWLQAVSDYRASASGGPSFGFEACIERIAEPLPPSLDLSSWRVAYCGAEPVRAQTLTRFAQRFAPAGFDPAALYPCYGLAEATLFVTGAPGGRGLKTLTVDRGALCDHGRAEPASPGRPARALAGCGRPWRDGEVSIRHPDTGEALPDRQVGEIVVRGAHLARGYLHDPAATAATFTAGGLRTGDLGFLDEGELYVAGRLKDVVIVRGVKHHAEDLEAVAQTAHPALAQGAGVAFSLDDGEREQVVIAQELSRDWVRRVEAPSVEAAIRERLLAEAGVKPDQVLLLKPGAIPRTTSGKVQRRRCRDDFASALWPVSAKRVEM